MKLQVECIVFSRINNIEVNRNDFFNYSKEWEIPSNHCNASKDSWKEILVLSIEKWLQCIKKEAWRDRWISQQWN